MASETSILDSTKPLLLDFQLIGNHNNTLCSISFIHKLYFRYWTFSKPFTIKLFQSLCKERKGVKKQRERIKSIERYTITLN